jgi:hypothetical protein
MRRSHVHALAVGALAAAGVLGGPAAAAWASWDATAGEATAGARALLLPTGPMPVVVADGKVADGKVAYGKVADGKVADGKVADGKVADGGGTVGKVADGGGTDGKVADGVKVTIDWPAAKLPAPVSGYRVVRRDVQTGATTLVCSGTRTRCVDEDVPDGDWTYGVVVVVGDNWTSKPGFSTPVHVKAETPDEKPEHPGKKPEVPTPAKPAEPAPAEPAPTAPTVPPAPTTPAAPEAPTAPETPAAPAKPAKPAGGDEPETPAAGPETSGEPEPPKESAAGRSEAKRELEAGKNDGS